MYLCTISFLKFVAHRLLKQKQTKQRQFREEMNT